MLQRPLPHTQPTPKPTTPELSYVKVSSSACKYGIGLEASRSAPIHPENTPVTVATAASLNTLAAAARSKIKFGSSSATAESQAPTQQSKPKVIDEQQSRSTESCSAACQSPLAWASGSEMSWAAHLRHKPAATGSIIYRPATASQLSTRTAWLLHKFLPLAHSLPATATWLHWPSMCVSLISELLYVLYRH